MTSAEIRAAAEAELVTALEAREAQVREAVDAARREGAVWTHAGLEGLVLDHGRIFRADARSDLTGRGFSDAASHAKQIREGTYVEGFVLTEQGELVAAAWAARGERVMFGPPARAYLGVPLSEDFRAATVRRRHTAYALHDQQRDRWTFVRHGLPAGAVLDVGRPGPRARRR